MARIKKIADKAVDLLDDKISSSSTRAGRVVKRVEKMTRAGVSAKTQASQMTDNSPTKQKYDERDIFAFRKLATDSNAGVPVTQAQAGALIEDALANPAPIAKPAT